MKKVAFGVLFLLSAVSAKAQEMTADQIIDQYFENVGGKEAWSKMEGQKIVATAFVQGMEFPITIYEMKDGRKATHFEIQGRKMVQDAFDGSTLWSVSFMTMKAEKGTQEETDNYKLTIGEFPSALLNYKKMGYSIELDGEDVKEGVKCYKIKLTKKPEMVDGVQQPNIEYYYFDKDNLVPITVETEITGGPMKGQMAVTVLSDYQEVGGIYYPFSIKQGSGMGAFTLTVDSMEIDPKVDESVFSFPEEGK